MKYKVSQNGSVIVFVTLMIVLLLVMVGLGLDTGWLGYTRSQGQPAVDAAALVGASGVPTGSATEIESRIEALNAKNYYVKSLTNPIDGQVNGPNVTLIKYDFATGNITKVGTVGEANGVRVALEQNNPYGGSPGKGINTPLFLVPLLNLFGAGVSVTADVSVSAVAVSTAIPSFPVVITGCPTPEKAPWCKDSVDSSGKIVPKLCSSCSSESGEPSGGSCSLIRNPNPSDSAGWTNLQLNPPVSKPVVEAMLQTAETCENAQPRLVPAEEQTICLNNGNIPVLVEEIDRLYYPFQPNPTNEDADCFMIPVIDQNISNITSCQPVKKFATICIRKVYCPQCTEKPAQGGAYQQQVIADIYCPYDATANLKGCFSNRLVRDLASGM